MSSPVSMALPSAHQAQATASRLEDLSDALDVFWTLHAVFVIFFMQAGFALVEVGSVTSKSARDIMLKNVLDASVCLLVWWLVGYGVAGGGGNAFVGADFGSSLALDGNALETARWLLGYTYASSCGTIVSGAIAERTHHVGYIISSIITSALVYPAVCHWLWSAEGWLAVRNPRGALLGGAFDFAGSGVVHLTGGVLALSACIVVGPRAGRFAALPHGGPHSGGSGRCCRSFAAGRRATAVDFRGQSSSFIMLGTFFLWFGWLAFNTGSVESLSGPGSGASPGATSGARVAAKVATRTMLSGGAGCIAVTTIEYWRSRRWSLPTSCFGILAGTLDADCASAFAHAMDGGPFRST
mmetsp:Transcript_5431/g.14315  ORF Transcript_5431/g.14315 Transcript_5431/m.14315 type:complete len:355 (+) Transcript_5431:1-1065(+)